jgi:HAD superfamily hydrolase (TIGR01509 family)
MLITHVIYDMDGLLLNTEPFYTEASQIIAGRFGKVFDWSVKSKMIGRRATDSARALVETLQLPITPEEYLVEREHILEHLFPKAEPLPGAVRLTMHLHGRGIPQAVATSSDNHHFELKTRRHRDWFRIFEVLVKGDDPAVRHGKPAPDMFLVAAGRMNAEPAHCLVFEDAPSGTEAALAAGMQVIAVPDPNMDRSVYAGAAQILSNLNEFDPAVWGLPPI